MDLTLLATPWLGTPLYLWLAFLSLVALLLAFDLGVLHRKSEEISIRQSLVLSGGYIVIGLTFGAFHACSVAALNQWFDARQQGRAQALYGSVSFGAGGMVGGLISGWLWAPFGGGWAFALSSLFALAGCVLLARLWHPDEVVRAG